MYDVGIVIPLIRNSEYEHYRTLAEHRAMPTTYQSDMHHSIGIMISEGDTLQEARNRGAKHIGADWLVFLDADDALDYRYVENMMQARGDIRQPSTVGYTDGVLNPRTKPTLIPQEPLWERNTFVVGSMLNSDLFHAVGGFDDDPVYEDWCLFCRMYAAGAVIGTSPDSIYRVHTDSTRVGRNQGTPDEVKARVMSHVRRDVLPQVKERGWE